MTTITTTRTSYAGVMHDIDAGSDIVSTLAQADLLWGVSKQRLHVTFDDGRDPVLYPDRHAIVREDVGADPIPLAVVGDTYEAVTNLSAAEPLEILREQGIIEGYEQAGMTRGGRHVFISCRLSSQSTIEGDEHARYLMCAISHDGTGSVRLVPRLRRIACMNETPMLAKWAKAIVSIPHRRGANDLVRALPAAVERSLTVVADWEDEWQTLMRQPVGAATVDAFITRLFPTPHGPDVTQRMRNTVTERRHAVARLIDGPNNAGIVGSMASLYAGASEWDQHYRGKDPARRSTRLLEGRSDAFLSRAWDLVGAL